MPPMISAFVTTLTASRPVRIRVCCGQSRAASILRRFGMSTSVSTGITADRFAAGAFLADHPPIHVDVDLVALQGVSQRGRR